MTSAARLQELLDAALRHGSAEPAFFQALLTATVYAHVPRTPAPPNRVQFVQFVRPDNGQTVLPFFSDRSKAQLASAGNVGILAMSGRRLLELTRGATLMLNPNDDYCVLYPEEVAALLDGRAMGSFGIEKVQEAETVGACMPSVPVDALGAALKEHFAAEPAVQAAHVAEIHRGKDFGDVSLFLAIVVAPAQAERIMRTTMVAIQPVLPELALPLVLACVAPGEPLPSMYRQGVCVYEANASATDDKA